MICKATVSFAGAVSMIAGEERDVPENVAAPLLACGYLVKETAKQTAKSTAKPSKSTGKKVK